MSLLDDAKKIQAIPPVYEDQGIPTCLHCKGKAYVNERFDDPTPQDVEHAPDCSWLAMPRIVAVLEAAERIDTSLRTYPRSVWDNPADELVDELCRLVKEVE